MTDAHHEIITLRATNVDLQRRIATLEAQLREHEAAEALLRENEAREERMRQTLLAIHSADTEGGQADEKVRQTESFYRALIEHAPDGVVLIRDGEFAYLSPSAMRLFGYSLSDMRTGSPVTMTHPDDLPYVTVALLQVLEDPSQVPMIQYRFKHKDGSWVWIESTISNLLPVAGVEALVINFHDISERRRAEDALRDREGILRAIIDNIPFEFWARDLEERCFMQNAALVQHWGSILGQRPEDASVSPEDHAIWKTNNRRALDGEVVHEEVAYRVGGQMRSYHSIVAPIRIGDTTQGILGMNIDITERKQAEAALEAERALLSERVDARTADLRSANADLARAARLKDEFLANMSHDLRTPLNDILGRAELLEAEIYGPISPKQAEALRSIDASGRHLLAMITDILDLSKIEAGKLTLQLEAVDVRLVCQMSLHMVAESAFQKQIEFGLTLDDQIAVIAVDERRLKQILVNLLSNAVKFTPAGGKIGLEVAGDAQRQTITFTVWDTGIGIAEEQRERLFQPFTQIDSGLNRQYTGTGLGLSLVQRLTQAHGGSVALSSTPGQGSRFSVTLPWRTPQAPHLAPASAEQAPAPPPQAEPAGPGRASQRILLVDDTESNNAVVAEYLGSHGYAVVTAWNGAEALELIAAERPDIVLMDIQMPGMDGLTAIRRIRGDTATANVPIIALTALAMPGDRERCLEAGANAYLCKPVSLRTLRTTVATLLGADEA
ncbi:MAG: ATP-binding protein [Chloroflexales bacterium]